MTNPSEYIVNPFASVLTSIAAADFTFSLSPDLNDVMPDKVVVDILLFATIVISPEVPNGASEYVGPVATILIAFCTLKLLVSFISLTSDFSIIVSMFPVILLFTSPLI